MIVIDPMIYALGGRSIGTREAFGQKTARSFCCTISIPWAGPAGRKAFRQVAKRLLKDGSAARPGGPTCGPAENNSRVMVTRPANYPYLTGI